jgi:hypothetical protein
VMIGKAHKLAQVIIGIAHLGWGQSENLHVVTLDNQPISQINQDKNIGRASASVAERLLDNTKKQKIKNKVKIIDKKTKMEESCPTCASTFFIYESNCESPVIGQDCGAYTLYCNHCDGIIRFKLCNCLLIEDRNIYKAAPAAEYE